MQRSGIKVLPHIINAVVLTSALSAANLGLIHASRSLFGLASNGQAPKIFLKTNKHGLPWVGVVFAALFLPLSYLSVSSGTSQVFSWFQSITSSNLLVNWSVFALDHIALHRALKAQGYSRKICLIKFLVDNMLVLYHYFFIIIFIYRWICCIY